MTDRRKYVLCAIAGAGAAGLIGIGAVSAASSATSTGSLASKIASTFHLNQTDVQKVIDQNRTDNQAARAAEAKTRLDEAVKAGTITQAQEDLIVSKQKELLAAREAINDATTDEATRRATIKTEMDALKQWATDNKIPLNLLHPMGRHGRGMDRPDTNTN